VVLKKYCKPLTYKTMSEYLRLPFPDYQFLMEAHAEEWADETAAIGDSDVLVPAEWVRDAGL
jgi:hypothetical protein